ncbi:15463_t:CDS:2, partial [Dentiscutata heterogama]
MRSAYRWEENASSEPIDAIAMQELDSNPQTHWRRFWFTYARNFLFIWGIRPLMMYLRDFVAYANGGRDEIFYKAIHAIHLREGLKDVTEKDVSWKDTLRSRVISDSTEIITSEILLSNSHDGKWKESDENLKKVAKVILDALNEVIVIVLRASLKNLPIGKTGFITIADRESLANKNRYMFMFKHKKKKYELMYGECSRLVCDKQKEVMDRTKLWREIKDGMFLVLIRDEDEIHRLYELRFPTIPVKPSNSDIVFDFVETLLILR